MCWRPTFISAFAVCAATLAYTGESSAQVKPDYATLTREYFSAVDRVDRDTITSMLCENALVISPRGIVSKREQLLRTLGAGRPAASLTREWQNLTVHDLGASKVVTGLVTLRSAATSGRVESMVTVHWTAQPQPCIAVVQRMPAGEAAEAAFWNDVFVLGEGFNAKPNAWLVEVIKNVKPGRALDVAMGQGRNAVWLASQGWDVTGYDIAGEGMRIAREAAAAQKLKINTVLSSTDEFDFGREQWDLVAIVYAGGREGEIKRAAQGLKRGGILVLEGFFGQPEAGMPGGGVMFDRKFLEDAVNEAGLSVVRIEAPSQAGTDYGPPTMRAARLLARKP